MFCRELEESLLTRQGREANLQQEQEQRLQQRLTAVRNRLDQAYLDKLDGKITEEFWSRKSAEWHAGRTSRFKWQFAV